MNGFRCDECKFWKINPQDLNTGVCQLKAPRLFMVQTNKGVQMLSSQPTTTRDTGCAEGAPKLLQ